MIKFSYAHSIPFRLLFVQYVVDLDQLSLLTQKATLIKERGFLCGFLDGINTRPNKTLRRIFIEWTYLYRSIQSDKIFLKKVLQVADTYYKIFL